MGETSVLEQLKLYFEKQGESLESQGITDM